MVEGRELAGHLVRLVEGGVDGPRQSQPVGDGGQSRQHGESIGPAHDVEVVDLAALFPQTEPLGQEEEVELGPFRRLRHLHEGAELDVAAGARVAPDRGVVHAGEVGGQVHLSLGRVHGRLTPLRSDWPAA